MTALGYPGAKISLKEDVVPTLFPIVEDMLMPSRLGSIPFSFSSNSFFRIPAEIFQQKTTRKKKILFKLCTINLKHSE